MVKQLKMVIGQLMNMSKKGKLMPSHRLMVAVVLCDKPVCVGKGHRFYSQHRLRLHQLYGGLP